MALQNLCLDTIVDTFDRHFSVYSSSDDAYVKKKFEFLQRIYSEEMATKLYRQLKIDDRNIDFVLNKNLKTFDAKWTTNCSWETVERKIAEIGHKIKKAVFDHFSPAWKWHTIFLHLRNLEVLHFCNLEVVHYKNAITCADLVLISVLKNCPNIQEIQLFNNRITDGELKYLLMSENKDISCPKLKEIRAQCTNLSVDVVKYFVKKFPSLEVLNYTDLAHILYEMHHKDLSTIEKVKPYKFTELKLFPKTETSLNNYDNLLKLCFSLCPNLKHLIWEITEPQQLKLASEMSNLKTLHIYYYESSFLDVNDFLKLKGSRLTCLVLENCSVSLTTLAKSCRALNRLYLVDVYVKFDENYIPPFENLEALIVDISKLGFNRENFRSICSIWSSSPELKSIRFEDWDLTLPEVKTAILKCCEKSLVKRLELYIVEVEKQFILDILLTCRSLSVLYYHNSFLDTETREEIYESAKRMRNNIRVIFDVDY